MFLKAETPKLQRPRIQRLIESGAQVYLCGGVSRLGSYHVKELVTDKRTMFTESSTFTSKSRQNRERCCKMTSTVVLQAPANITANKRGGRMWIAS